MLYLARRSALPFTTYIFIDFLKEGVQLPVAGLQRVKLPLHGLPVRDGIFLGVAHDMLIFSIGICLLAVHLIMPTSMRLCLGLLFFAVGLLAMSFNYSLFQKALKKARQRYAFEIVELAKEICGPELYF